MGRLLDENLAPPLEPLEPLDVDLERALKGGTLDAAAVLRVARAMIVSSRVRRHLLTEGERLASALVELMRGSTDLAAAGRDLQGAFEEGVLRDSASPELAARRRTARRLADSIRERLERLMRSSRLASCLQEDYLTQRGERYVLPVRAEARTQVPGLVHDTSHSGQTLFVEPSEVIDEGNRLTIARAAVAEEERRILAEYSREIAAHAGQLQTNLACLAALDRVLAGTRLGERLAGRVIEVEERGFDLRAARHPLMVLAGQPTVANDIRLPEGARALIVSGPNAGGKTVVLKTLGLVALMAHCGLPVPAAEGSRVGRLHTVAAVIGDDQDLDRGLSTFSGHVRRISDILSQAEEGCLVLLDELAADTDPRQGAALAAAILESLVDSGAEALVTTHYEELKQLPLRDERFANASVGFDLESMAPSFELHPQIPGRSLTLDIARRLGMSEEVLARAAGQLDGGQVELDRMLESLERERTGLARLRGELQQRAEQATADGERHRSAAEELVRTRHRLLGEERATLLREITDARREVAGVIESLRGAGDMKNAVTASRRLIEVEGRLQQATPDGEAIPGSGAAAPSELEPGDRVRLLHLGGEGVVTAFDRAASMVAVRLGSLATRAPLEQVRLIQRRPVPTPVQPRTPAPAPPAEARPVEVRTSANTLDLRGLRVDEALAELEPFLDRLFASGEPAAFLIHGHGTGALKSAVRAALKGSPYTRHFRSGTLEEGGDGVTVVTLK